MASFLNFFSEHISRINTPINQKSKNFIYNDIIQNYDTKPENFKLDVNFLFSSYKSAFLRINRIFQFKNTRENNKNSYGHANLGCCIRDGFIVEAKFKNESLWALNLTSEPAEKYKILASTKFKNEGFISKLGFAYFGNKGFGVLNIGFGNLWKIKNEIEIKPINNFILKGNSIFNINLGKFEKIELITGIQTEKCEFIFRNYSKESIEAKKISLIACQNFNSKIKIGAKYCIGKFKGNDKQKIEVGFLFKPIENLELKAKNINFEKIKTVSKVKINKFLEVNFRYDYSRKNDEFPLGVKIKLNFDN